MSRPRVSEWMAVVVGGSSGIGRAFGLELARAGASVLFAGRSEEALREAVTEARSAGARDAWYEIVDVADSQTLDRAVTGAVQRAGKLDLIFNGAGIGMLAYAEDTSLASYEEMIRVNLMGVIYGTHAAYARMKQQRHGHIVNVASLAGLVPIPASTAYCAAKYGVVGFSQALRMEAAEFGVHVNVVCPGAVDTPIVGRSTYVNIDGAKWAASPPPGGLLPPERCAQDILAGVIRNRPIVTPGAAGTIATISRHFPSLWRLAGRSMARKVRDARTLPGSVSRTPS